MLTQHLMTYELTFIFSLRFVLKKQILMGLVKDDYYKLIRSSKDDCCSFSFLIYILLNECIAYYVGKKYFWRTTLTILY